MGTCQWLCCPSQVPAGTPSTRASEPARTTTALERGQILLLEHVRDLLRHCGELPRWLRRYLPFLRGLLTAVRMAAPRAGPVLAGVAGITLSEEKPRLHADRGSWQSYYDDTVVEQASVLDVDHLISVPATQM
ncbi:hypothetical protein [Nonomuraea bangladeshensis]|uniref:hypothetical protein n=1 Tax=Nonomuraea bangladeshensis TaxID=404385 RepID=UPI003C2B650F